VVIEVLISDWSKLMAVDLGRTFGGNVLAAGRTMPAARAT
jgi:hypothetical protein